MANVIRIKRSSTPGAIPTSNQLVEGELAANIADGKLYLKNSVGAVVSLTSPPAGANEQVQFNDSGAFGGDDGLTFNKTSNSLVVSGAVYTPVIVNILEDSYLLLTTAGSEDSASIQLNASGVVGGATISVSGATTFTNNVVVSDLAVNGGDLTTSATTFNLLNSTATTINLGGAVSSTINLGALGGTSTIDLNSNVLKEVELRTYFETHGTATYTGGMVSQIEVNLAAAQVFLYTLTEDANGGINVTNPPIKANTSVGFTLVLTQAAAATYAVGFDNISVNGDSVNIKWAGGTSPTMTSIVDKTDIYSFVTYDGGTYWYGFVGGQDF